MAAVPLSAQDLSFTLSSNSGAGYVPNIAPEAYPPCIEPGCVLFSGTLTDNDTDDSFLSLSNANPVLPGIGVTFSSGPASGGLTIDDTFGDLPTIPGTLIGDPTGLTDFGIPNAYSGPLFGIDIASGTTPGDYSGTVTIYANGGTDDPGNLGFTVSQQITVDVLAPEPATAGFAMAGLAALGAWIVRCAREEKWRSSEASR